MAAPRRYIEESHAVHVPRLVRAAQAAAPGRHRYSGQLTLSPVISLEWRLTLPTEEAPRATLALRPTGGGWCTHTLLPHLQGLEWYAACYGCGHARRDLYIVPGSGEGWCRVCHRLHYLSAELVNPRAVKVARGQHRRGEHAPLMGALLSTSPEEVVPVIRALEAEGVLSRSLLPPTRWKTRRPRNP